MAPGAEPPSTTVAEPYAVDLSDEGHQRLVASYPRSPVRDRRDRGGRGKHTKAVEKSAKDRIVVTLERDDVSGYPVPDSKRSSSKPRRVDAGAGSQGTAQSTRIDFQTTCDGVGDMFLRNDA